MLHTQPLTAAIASYINRITQQDHIHQWFLIQRWQDAVNNHIRSFFLCYKHCHYNLTTAPVSLQLSQSLKDSSYFSLFDGKKFIKYILHNEQTCVNINTINKTHNFLDISHILDIVLILQPDISTEADGCIFSQQSATEIYRLTIAFFCQLFGYPADNCIRGPGIITISPPPEYNVVMLLLTGRMHTPLLIHIRKRIDMMPVRAWLITNPFICAMVVPFNGI